MADNKIAVQQFIKNPNVQKSIEDRLKGRAGQFTTSLLSLANNNAKIAECEPQTVMNAAMTAASLDLPINQNLGFAYIIPYNNKGKMEAQFQMGYKGFIQLAQRSGQYKTIAATAVYKGQIVSSNPLEGNAYDWSVKPKGDPIGYVAMFKLINGFEKENYMTLEEINAHGKRYSQSFKSGYGPWKDNFDVMAQKTVIKGLLSTFGPLSTEMQTAIESDQAVIKENGEREYIDGTSTDDQVSESTLDAIGTAENKEELAEITDELTVEQRKVAAPFVAARLKQLASEAK